jgi:FtsP/CotA-like multicopper oxidase with cupredoxin domain
MNRREFLARSGLATAGAFAGRGLPWDFRQQSADYTIRIAPLDLELAPGVVTRTTAFNGSVPGALLRWRAGRPITVDVLNDTDADDWVHWHGLIIPSGVDGSEEEGTPPVPAHGARRYTFTPQPAGFRWYHSHRMAGHNLRVSTYSGEFGFLMIEPDSNPAPYDQEAFLALHDWDAYPTGGDDGFRFVMYNHASINGRLLGFGEPLRVREGERVLLHVLNASATDIHWLALPGHSFRIIALDGNPVPVPAAVETLRLGPGERVDAVVTMDRPGVWVLGECDDRVRTMGMGIVIEYANQQGPPRWTPPVMRAWDYLRFANPVSTRASLGEPAERIPMAFRSRFHGHGDFEHWTINDQEFPEAGLTTLTGGRRYRLVFDNKSSEDHPVHLHRHRFELVAVNGTPTAGLLKDVVIVPAFTTTEVEFTADAPGRTLFHCHMQDHMDFGFMHLFQYA